MIVHMVSFPLLPIYRLEELVGACRAEVSTLATIVARLLSVATAAERKAHVAAATRDRDNGLLLTQ